MVRFLYFSTGVSRNICRNHRASRRSPRFENETLFSRRVFARGTLRVSTRVLSTEPSSEFHRCRTSVDTTNVSGSLTSLRPRRKKKKKRTLVVSTLVTTPVQSRVQRCFELANPIDRQFSSNVPANVRTNDQKRRKFERHSVRFPRRTRLDRDQDEYGDRSGTRRH